MGDSMLSKIKRFLSRILPMPHRTMVMRLNELNSLIILQNDEINRKLKILADGLTYSSEQINQLSKTQADTEKSHESQKQDIQRIYDTQKQYYEKLNSSITENKKRTQIAVDNSNESVWAQIFNNTISGCDWLIDRAFSPGRWAVGYQYLYVLYRVLNEVTPQRILELGLGQSTRLIGQYAQRHPGVIHHVVEHDPEWIDFFTSGFALSEQTHIVNLPIEMEAFSSDNVPVYTDFSQTFSGQKFDLISIDAPFGYLSKEYSRIDILKLLPRCLSDSFVIMMDDYNRNMERNTVELIKQFLDESGIPYCTGTYHGQKATYVIASENLRFVCSM